MFELSHLVGHNMTT